MLFDREFIQRFDNLHALTKGMIMYFMQTTLDLKLTEDLCVEAVNENCLPKLKWLLENKCPFNMQVFETAIIKNNMPCLEYLLNYVLQSNSLDNDRHQVNPILLKFGEQHTYHDFQSFINTLIEFCIHHKQHEILHYLRQRFDLKFETRFLQFSITFGDFESYLYVKTHLDSLEHLSEDNQETFIFALYISALNNKHFNIFKDLNESGMFVLHGLLRELKCRLICSGDLTYIKYMLEHIPDGNQFDEFFIHCAEKTKNDVIIQCVKNHLNPLL